MTEPKTLGAQDIYFELFNEIGILEQLGRTMFEQHLPAAFLLSHFTILNHLVRVKDGRTPLELANAFQVPKTTMTHSLTILERHGLVRVDANPSDGRSKTVWLTDEGRAFRLNAIASVRKEFASIAKAFPPPKVKLAMPALRELRQIMDAMRERKQS